MSHNAEVVDLATQLGFKVRHVSGSGHIVLDHPNGTVTLASTPSEYRGRKNAIAVLERVSGQKLPRANHRRSRKGFKPSGFNPWQAARESQDWHERHDGDVAELMDRRIRLIDECVALSENRARLRDIPQRLNAIAEVEQKLRHYGIPVTPFDPYTLAAAR